MWSHVSLIGTNIPDISIHHFIPGISIHHFLPAVPTRFFSSVGSTLVAAAVGGAYGLVGRVIYPNTGISPLHYAIWFSLAFQIKQVFLSAESNFDKFLGVGAYLEELEQLPEDELDIKDLVRYHCWKVIQLKNQIVQAIDSVFVKTLNIRPYDEISVDNVEEASFLEMCRYRIWPVFKLTVLDTASFALAYRLSNGTGFSLPSRTAVPLLIVIRSIVRDIILVPALYVYARLCNQIADGLEGSDEVASHYRARWIRWCLPSL